MGRPTKLSDQTKAWFHRRSICRNRPIGTREEIERFLIVCEGEKTEPFYFRALAEALPRHSVEVQVTGEGMNTLSLV